MKIKIVVRPDEAQKAEAAAESARRARQRRARWGLAALFGLVALSAAAAFFFIGQGTEPVGPDEQPVASAPPAGSNAAAGEQRATPAEPPSQLSSATPAAPTAGGDMAAVAPEAAGADDPLPEAAGGQTGEDRAAGSPGPAGEPQQAPDKAPAVAEEAASDGAEAPGETAALPAPVAPLPQSRPSSPQAGEGAKAPAVARVPAKPETGVVRAQLASEVVGREPVDSLQSPVSVAAGSRNLFYFNEFRNLNGQTVTHRWEYDGRLMAAIRLRIDGNRWRAYSSKRIGTGQRGNWRVTTVDARGAVLARTEFRVE